MAPNRPLCPESIRWAAGQLADELQALGLNYGSEGPIADLARATNVRLAAEWNRLEKSARDQRLECFYFGTWPRSGGGHYWFNQHGQTRYELRLRTPFDSPDGTYQPNNGEKQGPAALRHKDGWTILAWWDRTEDSRGGCCSALAWPEEVGFEFMVSLLETRYPKIAARRPLTRWPGKTRAEDKASRGR